MYGGRERTVLRVCNAKARQQHEKQYCAQSHFIEIGNRKLCATLHTCSPRRSSGSLYRGHGESAHGAPGRLGRTLNLVSVT